MDNNGSEYKQWLVDLKLRIRQSQVKAAVKVNTELLRLYWDLGRDIVDRQMEAAWGSKFFEMLSKDLLREFPELEGFSKSNLFYMKKFYLFYSRDGQIVQQAVALFKNAIVPQAGTQLQTAANQENIICPQVVDKLENHPVFQIPWGHHREIITKCQSIHEALFYVQKTIEHGWSRAVLMNFMEANLYEAQGKALNNFAQTLPAPQSDLAREITKDPYNLGFTMLTNDYKEKELEKALVDNITKLLLELGAGFAFVGRQVPIQIGETDHFMDLLFYHTKLHCYVVVELKACKFDAAFTGKLGLYVEAVNQQVKSKSDKPTIGLLVCKSKDNVEVQYSLKSSKQPIGISEYQLSNLVPKNYKSSLPSIEEIEKQLKGEVDA